MSSACLIHVVRNRSKFIGRRIEQLGGVQGTQRTHAVHGVPASNQNLALKRTDQVGSEKSGGLPRSGGGHLVGGWPKSSSCRIVQFGRALRNAIVVETSGNQDRAVIGAGCSGTDERRGMIKEPAR